MGDSEDSYGKLYSIIFFVLLFVGEPILILVWVVVGIVAIVLSEGSINSGVGRTTFKQSAVIHSYASKSMSLRDPKIKKWKIHSDKIIELGSYVVHGIELNITSDDEDSGLLIIVDSDVNLSDYINQISDQSFRTVQITYLEEYPGAMLIGDRDDSPDGRPVRYTSVPRDMELNEILHHSLCIYEGSCPYWNREVVGLD